MSESLAVEDGVGDVCELSNRRLLLCYHRLEHLCRNPDRNSERVALANHILLNQSQVDGGSCRGHAEVSACYHDAVSGRDDLPQVSHTCCTLDLSDNSELVVDVVVASPHAVHVLSTFRKTQKHAVSLINELI